MIKCNLSKLMGIHKLSIQDVHKKSSLNRNTISNLYHETVKRIDYDTINNKLCKLFNCQPGDLFEYIPYYRRYILLTSKYFPFVVNYNQLRQQ